MRFKNYMINEQRISTFFDDWIGSELNSKNITHIQRKIVTPGEFIDFPNFINNDLISILKTNGIERLYKHQFDAITSINNGLNIILTTGPSSGKSMVYWLPILNELFSDNHFNALLLFPTKALAYDQFEHVNTLLNKNTLFPEIKKSLSKKIAVYDGDTTKELRSSIRKQAQIILTNPDMLHFGILPNHFLWESFFERLKYVVLDEAHIYHGVFGSHVANVLRRLKRILQMYNLKPHFICTSATIGNAKPFIENLVEEKFELFENDYSPQGKKRIVFFNPPIINEDLGIRKSLNEEVTRIVNEFISHNVQTLVFKVTRKDVEKSLKIIKELNPLRSNEFASAYRSGYLAEDRRKLEDDFRSGRINVLFSTNALELGIDIGGLQSVILSGYPGTISSTLQQIGRAGRKQSEALAILVASSNPIDQYIIKRPEYLFVRTPENALINPNNPNILIEHLKIALGELSFVEEENFGNLNWDQIVEYMDQFVHEGFAVKNKNKYLIINPSRLENNISLRNLSGNTMKLINVTNDSKIIIGEIDYSSSLWMTHPNAIYLHMGDQYQVIDIDFNNNEIYLKEIITNYFTEPKLEKTYEIIDNYQTSLLEKLTLNFGKIKVTQKVIGYKEILWDSYQKISENELDMPSIILNTDAMWFHLPEIIVDQVIDTKLALSQRNNYGSEWVVYKNLIRKRDNYTCQHCGTKETDNAHHIHHKRPIKLFESIEEANQPSNLITLCPKCHRQAEIQVRVRSGMAGLAFLFRTLSPLFIMCGPEDIDVILDSKKEITGVENSIFIYDNIPFGMGLSLEIFKNFPMIISEMFRHVNECGCHSGCPSCVGPVSDEGYGGKEETKHLLELLLKSIYG